VKILERYPQDKSVDTLCIIKRTRSPFWYVQFYVNKNYSKSGYHFESTKIKEKRSAWSRAKDIHRQFDPAKYEIPINTIKDNFNTIVYQYYDKEIEKYKLSFPDENYKNSRWWSKKNRWKSRIASFFDKINYRIKSEVQTAGDVCLLMMKTQHKLEEKTVEKYKADISMAFQNALDLDYISFVPRFQMPEYDVYEDKPKEWFRYHEITKIIDHLKEKSKITRDLFFDEMSDYINFLRSSPFRPGKETSNIRFKHMTINDKEMDRVIVNIKLPKTKTSSF